MKRNYLSFFGLIAILVAASICAVGYQPAGPEVAPGERPRISDRWEETWYRQMVWDDIFIQRDSEGNFIGAIISENADSTDIYAIMDSSKANHGSEIGFLPGLHVVSNTLHFGPHTRIYGIHGGDDSLGTRDIPVIRYRANNVATPEGFTLFAVDPEYFDSTGTVSYDGLKATGFVDDVIIENLAFEINTPGWLDPFWEIKPGAAIDFRGVTRGFVLGCAIKNWTYGIIAGANQCDSLFFLDDGEWSTKGWNNVFEGNTFTNPYWADANKLGYSTIEEADSVWGDAASGFRQWADSVGPTGILLVNCNSSSVVNNSFAGIFTKLWVPHSSAITVFGNNFETSADRDSLYPHVLFGYWADGLTSTVPYDSTHPLVRTAAAECATINYGGNDAGIRFSGTKGVDFMGNRLELGNIPYQPSLYIGPNTHGFKVNSNLFTKSTSSPATQAKYPVFVDYGEATEAFSNTYAIDGPAADETAWNQGDKSLYHILNSRPNGGKILLDAGTYDIGFSDDGTGSDSWYEIPSNTHLIGVPGKTILRVTNGVDFGDWGWDRGILHIASGDSNITIEGITFDGNSANQTTGSGPASVAITYNSHIGIAIGNDGTAGDNRNITIKNCEFLDLTRAIMIKAEGVNGNVLEGINITGNKIVPRVQLNKTTGDPIDPTGQSVAAFWIHVTAPDSLIGLSITNNYIEDNGVRQILAASAGNKYGQRMALTLLDGANISRSIIENNYVNMTTTVDGNGDAITRVDTLWVDYDYLGESPAHINRFYDIGRFKADTSKVGAYEFGDDGELPWFHHETIGTAGQSVGLQGLPAIAVDSEDNIHVVYYKLSGIDADILHVEKSAADGSVSSPDVVDDGLGYLGGTEIFNLSGTDLIVGTSDTLHFFYRTYDDSATFPSSSLMHAYKPPSGSWAIDSTGLASNVAATLAFNVSSGNVADFFNYGVDDTFFVAHTAGSDSVNIAKGNVGVWTDTKIYTGMNTVNNAVVHCDASGHVHVAFISGTTTLYLIHAESTDRGVTWPAAPDTLHTFTGAGSNNGVVSMTSNSNEKVFVVFHQQEDGKLYVADNVSGWDVDQITERSLDSSQKMSISAIFDSNDTLRVFYRFDTAESDGDDENKWMNMATRISDDNWRITPRVSQHFGSGIIVASVHDSKDNWWVAEREAVDGGVDPGDHPGADGRDVVVLHTNKDTFVEEGMYYYNRDVERLEVFSGAEQDTVQTYRDYNWQVTWAPTSAIFDSDTPADSGGYIQLLDDVPYVFPFDARLVGVECIVGDTTSIFQLELYKNEGIEPDPPSTSALFSVYVDSTDVDSIGTDNLYVVFDNESGTLAVSDTCDFAGGAWGIVTAHPTATTATVSMNDKISTPLNNEQMSGRSPATWTADVNGTPIRGWSYFLSETSPIWMHAEEEDWRDTYDFNQGDVIKPFARMDFAAIANKLRLTLYFRRR